MYACVIVCKTVDEESLGWSSVSAIGVLGTLPYCGQPGTADNNSQGQPTVQCRSPSEQASSFSEECNDRKSECRGYADQGYCVVLPAYMKVMCKKSCELCTEIAECIDSNPNCGYWAKYEECVENPNWMLLNCERSCNQCKTSYCRDHNRECKKWADEGECEKNTIWMNKYCRKSCNKCKGSGSGENATIPKIPKDAKRIEN